MRATTSRPETALQDAMLEYFLGQARFADANVERRLEREPFDVKTILKPRDAREPAVKTGHEK